jgi:hypothetical protein
MQEPDIAAISPGDPKGQTTYTRCQQHAALPCIPLLHQWTSQPKTSHATGFGAKAALMGLFRSITLRGLLRQDRSNQSKGSSSWLPLA